MIGYEHFEHQGFAWRRHHAAVVPLAMPHLSPSDWNRSLGKLLIKRGALFARWEESFDQENPTEWWHVIKGTEENFEALSKNTKSKVRRGARVFEAKLACRKEICGEGYSVYRAAFGRYDTFERVYSEKKFQQAVADLPAGTEFWTVREKESGQMVAFSENLVRDNACFYVTIWFCPEALKRYSGYLLIHKMNEHYLNDRRLKYVSDGARNISHQTNIHEFLEQKFGFRRAYARLRVVYAPGVGLAVWLLYPLRKWFSRRSAPMLQKVGVLLEQERIRRACATETDGVR